MTYPRYERSFFLPLLSGMLLVLTLPYIGLWPLVWIALIPFFLFATNTNISRPRLVFGAILTGFIYNLGLAYPLSAISGWWWYSSGVDTGIFSNGSLYVDALILLAFWFALWFVPVAFALRHLVGSRFAPIFLAFIWVLFEWPHAGFGPEGFTWGTLGYALVDSTYVKHIAVLPLVGVYILSFLVVAINYALMVFFRFSRDRAGGLLVRIQNTLSDLIVEWRVYVGFWFAILLLFFSGCFGVVREVFGQTIGSPLRVALVSSNISTLKSITEKAYWEYRHKLEEVLKRGAVLVVFPENAFPYFELDERDHQLVMNASISLPGHAVLFDDLLAVSKRFPSATIVVGLHTFAGGGVYHNSAAYIQNGQVRALYHKRFLVPFTEYSPLWFHLRVLENLIPGLRSQYVDVDGIKTTALICSEVSATTLPIRDAVVIFAPSNDSVFTTDTSAKMELQMSKMRALEAHAYVLRPTKGGISAVIDPFGRVVSFGRDNVIIADITPPKK